MTLPATLPAVPTGFTQQMSTHLKFGRDGAAAVYTIRDPEGLELPITYRYKTGKAHTYEYRGYSIRGSDVIHKSWGELALAWAYYYKAVQRLVRAGRTEEQAMAVLDDMKPLSMVVIYDKPKDHPNGFAARTWQVGAGAVLRGQLLGADLSTLDAARELVPAGMVNVGRDESDESAIAEVWV